MLRGFIGAEIPETSASACCFYRADWLHQRIQIESGYQTSISEFVFLETLKVMKLVFKKILSFLNNIIN